MYIVIYIYTYTRLHLYSNTEETSHQLYNNNNNVTIYLHCLQLPKLMVLVMKPLAISLMYILAGCDLHNPTPTKQFRHANTLWLDFIFEVLE